MKATDKSNVCAVFSHERSGTHFLIEALTKNFGVEYELRHNMYDYRVKKDFDNIIYIFRDGRDVLVSFYRLLKSYELFYTKISPYFVNLSFSEFLKGYFYKVIYNNKPKWLDNNQTIDEGTLTYIINNMLQDPVSYWAMHIKSFVHKSIFVVRYSDLISNYEDELKRISKKFSYKFKEDIPVYVSNMVGPNPGKGMSGAWKNYFTFSDLEFFWNRAGITMEWFGYGFKGEIERINLNILEEELN